MAKKSKYVCTNCGANSSSWLGKCPVCEQWNTYEEEISDKKNPLNITKLPEAKPILLKNISNIKQQRTDTKNTELNRVLGGGIVPGSLILLGGEPGIGKSTLALQLALNINTPILYISGEESLQQIKIRADRIKIKSNNCSILNETSLENAINIIDKTKPEIVIIDSIQTLQTEKIPSTPGTIAQIRECTTIIQQYAKKTNTPFLIIGHINKEGNIAGPKILEHIVDVVLQFEGDKNFMFRILRSMKNRFGPTSEIGIFEMINSGLKEINNPSELLISSENNNLSGISIAVTLEGARPILVEIQALVSSAVYGNPQRNSTTFDLRRLNMLLAVLEKRAGFNLATKDVFLNITGGLRIFDTAIDLAIIAATLSSKLDIAIPKNICFAAEIGLSGEIRPVSRIEQRINEAQKLGMKKIFIASNNKINTEKKYKIEIIKVKKVDSFLKNLFKN